MSEKRAAKRILTIVMVFYVLVSVLAIAILNLSGSIFAVRGEANLVDYFTDLFGSDEEVIEESFEEADPETKLQGLEALDNKEEAPEPEPEPEPEPVSEPEPEPEPEPEEEPSEEPSSEPEPEEHYYSFKTNNTDTILRMREEPGEDARVIYEIRPGSTGYVIDLGDEWSKVSIRGHEGYCANEFLTMTEISEDEYNELKEKTYESTDSLDAAGAQTPDAAALNAALAAAAQAAALQSAEGQTQTPAADNTGTAGPTPSEDP